MTEDCKVRALNLSDARVTNSGALEMNEVWAETKHQGAPTVQPLKCGASVARNRLKRWIAPLRRGGLS